jgi:hypothetical protein
VRAPDKPSNLNEIVADLVKLHEPGDEDLNAAAVARAQFERLARDPAWLKRLNESDDEDPKVAAAARAAIAELKSLAERMGAADSKLATELDIRGMIDFLRQIIEARPLWGHDRENQDTIEAIDKQIDGLQALLRAMPQGLRYLLFAFEESGEGRLPFAANEQRVLARLKTAVATLSALRARCRQLVAAPPGLAKNADYIGQIVSEEAYDFMVRHGTRPTKSSSKTSPFNNTANLFYQAVTGRVGNLEYACRATFERKGVPKKRKRFFHKKISS